MSKAEVSGVPAEFRDEANLYRLSGMVDTLRDTAKDLLGVDVSATTLERLGARYVRLRKEIRSALTDGCFETLDSWAPVLGTAPSVDEIFDASSTLARLLDNILGLGQFLVGRKLQRYEWREVLGKLGGDVDDTPTEPTGNGQYL